MTYRINRKSEVPRITDDGRKFTFSRGKFLDSTTWSYFSPGQSFQSQRDDYEPPTDWPAAGMLLRVPQVAWLTPFFPNISSLEPSDVTSAFESNPPYMDRQHTSQDGYDVDEYPATAATIHTEVNNVPAPLDRTFTDDVTWNVIPNEDYLAQVRLEAAFAEAKGRIEAVRPNRTWVQINTFHEEDYSGDDPDKVVDRYAHISSPNAFRHYFGTNFLHVFIGFPALGLLDSDGDGNPGWDYTYVGDPDWLVPPDDPTFGDSLFRVTESFDRFAGYAAHLYGYEHDWEEPPDSTTEFPDEVGDPIVPFVGSGAAALANLQLQATNGNAYLEATATELADYGFQYRGTTEPTADDIVNLIADHFGFDPDTGRDLA